MNWFGKNKGTVEIPVRRDAEAGQTTVAPARRGPVIRTSDFVTASPARPSSQTRVVETPPVQEAEIVRTEPVVADVVAPVTVAAPSGGALLLDGRSLLLSIWTCKWLIVALAIVFAVGGFLLAPHLPKKFSSATSLYFDPAPTVSADSSQASVTKDSFLAVVDSQMQILTSAHVLQAAALKLGLDKDPMFAGKATGPAAVRTVVGGLQAALKVLREDNTYVVNLTMTTKDPDKSADIANQIVDTYLEEEGAAAAGRYKDTSSVLDGRIEDLRIRLQEAEKAVEDYKASNDIISADGNLIADQRLIALNELLVATQNKTIEAKAKADNAAGLKVEDMVGSTSANDSSSQALAQLRRQYGTLSADVDNLQSQLGSRHPRLLAAKASLAGVNTEIQRELQRYVAAAQADLQQARKAEQDVAKELNVQKALQSNIAGRQIALNELQRKATAARDLYEAVLKRTGQASEAENLTTSNIRVISKAVPPLKPDGPGASSLMVAGVFGGLVFGIIIGVVVAMVRMLIFNTYLRGVFADLSRRSAARSS